MMATMADEILTSSDSSSDESEPAAQRDDLVNPYWIEDRDLRNGPIDFLPGVEVQFKLKNSIIGNGMKNCKKLVCKML